MNDQLQMIPIDRIRILNPRHRDRKKFELIVQSIKNLGLKKPIQVSLKTHDEDGGPGYDLVCGQGRIEAFLALGHREIPAVVVEISKEDRLLRSLAENMARRMAKPMEMMKEIERLQALGYSRHEIAQKLDVHEQMVTGLSALNEAGEGRLIDAALSGTIPLGVAIDIATTNDVDTQRELLKAYENKQLNQFSIRVVKRLMDRRRILGKQAGLGGSKLKKTGKNADSFVNAYRRESQRQKVMIRKARVCEAKLVFVVSAFNRLVADENFATLLRAEELATMPKALWDRVKALKKEAA